MYPTAVALYPTAVGGCPQRPLSHPPQPFLLPLLQGVDGRLEAHAGRLCEGVRLELQGKLEQALSDQTQRFASRLEEHSEVLVSTLQSSVTKVREEVQGMVAGAVAKEVAAGAAPGEKSPGRPLAALETELLAALEDRIADTLTAQQRAVQQVPPPSASMPHASSGQPRLGGVVVCGVPSAPPPPPLALGRILLQPMSRWRRVCVAEVSRFASGVGLEAGSGYASPTPGACVEPPAW